MGYIKYQIEEKEVNVGDGNWYYTGEKRISDTIVGRYLNSGSCENEGETCYKLINRYNDGRTHAIRYDGYVFNSDISRSEFYPQTSMDSVFLNSGMTSAVIGDCVTSIGNYVLTIAPDYFTSIIITVPDSVTTIGNGVFCSGDKGLEIGADIEVYIGSGVTSIGTHFLQNHPGWHKEGSTKLTITATTPPTLGQYAMYPNEMSTIDIFVPASSVLAYKSASGWSEFADRIQAIS